MDGYVVYFMLGQAPSEAQKLCRWSTWERCYELFDDVLGASRSKARVSSDQAFEIPLKSLKDDPPGIQRVTLKGVPGLARLPWTRENNRKWAESTEQVDPYSVHLFDTTIRSSPGASGKACSVNVILGNQHPLICGYPFNQSLAVAIAAPDFDQRPAAYWDGLVSELARLSFAVRVGRTRRPWLLSERKEEYGATRLTSSCLGFEEFMMNVNSTEFPSYFQTWEYLD